LAPVVQGITLFVIGMALLFAAMGLLILVMVVLERVFRTRPLVTAKQEPEESETVSKLAPAIEDEQVVAAIAVALAQLRSLDLGRSGLGEALEGGRGSWWTAGQIRQRQATAPHASNTPARSTTSFTAHGR